MNLEAQIAEFLATAEARPPRSKLEPYAELIRELRQRRWTFRRIAEALRKRFGVPASPSTIHDFVRVRARRPKSVIVTPIAPASPADPAAPASRKRRFQLEM